jgi:hypothetical protein
MVFIFKHKYRILLILILAIILLKGLFSERTLVNDGLGWDGATFGDFTKNIIPYLKNNYINKYYFQRIGTPLILHYIFTTFHIDFSNKNIVNGFAYLNIFFIILGVVYFYLISNKLKLKPTVEIIGFVSLFFCFPILKLSQFCPVLMDIPAYTIGIMLTYYYLNKSIIPSFLLIFLGSFVYPTFILFSLLFFFKFKGTTMIDFTNDREKNILSNKKTTSFNILHLLFSFSLPLFLVFIFIFLYYGGYLTSIIADMKNFRLAFIMKWFSFLCAFSYIIYLNKFPKSIFSLKQVFKSFNLFGILAAVLMVMLMQYLINNFSANTKALLTVESYLLNIITQTIDNPFNFIVAHVFYFGLLPIIAIFLIHEIKKEIISLGLGALSFFVVIVFFSVGNESRQLINYYPFFAILCLIAINKYWNISILFSVIYSVISLGLSHFWYSINAVTEGITYYSNFSDFSAFPVQRYFMFQGPWVSDYMYKIHLIVVVIILILQFVTIKKTKMITKKDLNLNFEKE